MRGEGAKRGWDGAGVCFEKRLGGAGREGKGGVVLDESAWRREKEERGAWRGSRQRGAAGNDP
jgi:hypothetical protein